MGAPAAELAPLAAEPDTRGCTRGAADELAPAAAAAAELAPTAAGGTRTKMFLSVVGFLAGGPDFSLAVSSRGRCSPAPGKRRVGASPVDSVATAFTVQWPHVRHTCVPGSPSN